MGRYKNNKDGTKTLIAGRGNTDTIESQIGYVEATNTAASAHAVGSYFINKSGQFVKATVAIDVGDTIAVGTNVVVTDIAGVLSELNSNILFEDNKWWSKERWTSSDTYGVFLLQAVQANRNYNFIISFLEGTYKILLDVQNPHQFSNKFSIDFDNNNHLKLSTISGEGGVINLTSLTKNLTFQYELLT